MSWGDESLRLAPTRIIIIIIIAIAIAITIAIAIAIAIAITIAVTIAIAVTIRHRRRYASPSRIRKVALHVESYLAAQGHGLIRDGLRRLRRPG